ncbi:MAG: DUF5677 domain-containing protein [Methanosarcinaceae archaeon]
MENIGLKWYLRQMNESLTSNLSRWDEHFSIVYEYENILTSFIEVYSKRDPVRFQDYVALLLVIRSFRLTISGIFLSLSGYPDSLPNLNRTVFEIWIRLIHIKTNPSEGAIGYLLSGKDEEIKAISAEIEFRRGKGMEYSGFDNNLVILKKQYADIESKALEIGCDPNKSIRNYGKLNVGQLIKKWGYPELKRAYAVDFRYSCGFIHERNVASYLYSWGEIDKTWFHLGPAVQEECFVAAWDIVRDLGMSIASAAEVLEDLIIIEKTQRLLQRVNEMTESISREVAK